MAFDSTQPSFLALQEAALPDTRRLIVWCGAGLGQPARLPGWTRLRRELDRAAREKARSAAGPLQTSIENQANSAQSHESPWVAFLMLQRLLGPTTYRDTIRKLLSPSLTSAIPEAYLQLWRMRLAGVITLNLDPLPQRAFSQVRPGAALIAFHGGQIGSNTHVLRNPSTPFLCHLHGVDHDVSSWVFTHEELRKLFQDTAYNTFVDSVLTTFTNLFIGMSADDIAVGGHLEKLTGRGIDFGSHFWVTHRNDQKTLDWGESVGMRTIHYNPANEHAELGELLTKLIQYVPADDSRASYPPAHIGSDLIPSDQLPSPEELRKLEPDEIRTLLNQKALDILRPENLDRDREFAEFTYEYALPIHMSWFVDTAPGRNNLVGYRLKERRNKGAFGQIYLADSPEGDRVAIKLLKDEIRTDPQLLHSFRRGVQAMRILSDNNVSGVVPYKEASEIPAFVVMDWIDGCDLRTAIERKLIGSWYELLQVARRIAEILKGAHSLPERVLHRDMRPANIMVKRDARDRAWQVFLLDFDLSWYLGSVEQSVIHGSDAYGYLAPEQIHPMPGMSSRHPSVDSYGLGMTFYFMITGSNPRPGQHNHRSWEQDVISAASRWGSCRWQSLPNRFGRLILNMTQESQSARWDLAQITLELQRMFDTERKTSEVRYADMVAEEIAARSLTLNAYRWDEDTQTASLPVSQPGFSLDVTGDQVHERVNLSVGRIRTSRPSRNRSGQRIDRLENQLTQYLQSVGWDVTLGKAGIDQLIIEASVSLDRILYDLDKAAETVDRLDEMLAKAF